MKEKDCIKLNGLIRSGKNCRRKIENYSNLRDINSLDFEKQIAKYESYLELAKCLSDWIDDIRKSKYLFNQSSIDKLENIFNQDIFVSDKYTYLVDQINTVKQHKLKKGKITLQVLLDAFRDKSTHSIKVDAEQEYMLFVLSVNDEIMCDLYNACSDIIDEKILNLSSDDLQDLVKFNTDLNIMILKSQELIQESGVDLFIDKLDDDKFSGHKAVLKDFLQFVPTSENIVLMKKEEDI